LERIELSASNLAQT